MIGTEWSSQHGTRRITGTLEHGGRAFYEVQLGDSRMRDLVPVAEIEGERGRDAARLASRATAQVKASAPVELTMLERFLATMAPLKAGRVRKSLQMLTRVNGRNAASRAAHLERMVAEGYRVTEADTFAHPDRVGFFDSSAFTSYGLAYAAWLAGQVR